VENVIFCTHPQISVGRSGQGERGWRGRWHAWEGESVQGFGGKVRRKETTV
jgi:hypothetical protein